ncbi:MAG: hypothetical protein JWO15_3558 [Sphingomonadales bacterium]|nr:hypothetical protein [Sphingomonadales bacterium]
MSKSAAVNQISSGTHSGVERYKDGTEVIYDVTGKPLTSEQAKERRRDLRYMRRLNERHIASWPTQKTFKRFSFANASEAKE